MLKNIKCYFMTPGNGTNPSQVTKVVRFLADSSGFRLEMFLCECYHSFVVSGGYMCMDVDLKRICTLFTATYSSINENFKIMCVGGTDLPP